MNARTDKTQENKAQTVANSACQKPLVCEPELQFIDNRLEAIAQRKLQGLANNTSQAERAALLQTTANNNSAKPVQKQEIAAQEMHQGKLEPASLQPMVSADAATRQPPSRYAPYRTAMVLQRLLIDLAPEENLGPEYVARLRPRREDQLVEAGDAAKTHVHQHPDRKKPPHFLPSEIQKSIQVDLKKIDLRAVTLDEPVILMGHGQTTKKALGEGGLEVQVAQGLQGYVVKELAKSLKAGLPKGYQGMIFLQGCYTASGASVDFGDSMALELLGRLKKTFPLISVKGNVGASHATGNGRDDLEFSSYSGKDDPAAKDQIRLYQELHAKYVDILKHLEADHTELERAEPEFEGAAKLSQANREVIETERELNFLGATALFKKVGQAEPAKSAEAESRKVNSKVKLKELESSVAALERDREEFRQNPEYSQWAAKLMVIKRPLRFLRKIFAEAEAGRFTFGFQERFDKELAK